MSTGPYIDVSSGNKVHFLNPREDDIDISDIAEGLSKTCRFYGHCKWYSVAEHCVRASHIVEPRFAFCTLLHDSAEAYIGDIHSFLKRLLPDYLVIEQSFEKVIAKKFGLPYPFPPQVKVADLTMLATEQKWLRQNKDWKLSPYKPLDRFTPWDHNRARREFMKRYNQLNK